MHTYLKKITDLFKQHNFALTNKSVLIACSGGADSIFLTHLLMRQKDKLNIAKLGIAYFNHKIRVSADKELLFVKNFAKKYNLPFFSGEVKTKVCDEAGMRKARYAFLQKIAKEQRFDFIATAHTKSDNSETVLMKILRGTYFGLRGITFKYKNIIRPVLCFTREEIIDYLKENGLSYIIDASNFENKYLRNRVRNELLPFIRKYSPTIDENLNHISLLFTYDDLYLHQAISNLKLPFYVISAQKFFSMPEPLRFRYLIENLKLITQDDNPLKFEHTTLLTNKEKNFKLYLKKGWIVERSFDYLYIYKASSCEKSCRPIEYTNQSEIEFNDFIVAFEQSQSPPQQFDDTKFYVFDLEQIKRPITITSRQKGDRVTLFPAGNQKKLKDIFIEKRVPSVFRDIIPVIRDGDNKILCVPGIVRSNIALVTKSTQSFLYIKNLIKFNKKVKIVK